MKKNLVWLILLIFTASLAGGCSSDSDYLSEGDTAPDFRLEEVSGSEFLLSDQLGEEPVLLYFSMAEG